MVTVAWTAGRSDGIDVRDEGRPLGGVWCNGPADWSWQTAQGSREGHARTLDLAVNAVCAAYDEEAFDDALSERESRR